jgi:hypothetical protein
MTAISQRTKAHTLPSRTSRHTSQNLAKSVLFPTQEEIQFFFSLPSEKIKTPDTQTNPTRTVKLNNNNGLQTRWTRTPAGNSVLPQLAVKCKIEAECSYQTFVQGDSEVLRNRQLRQHANRYASCLGDTTNLKHYIFE